MLPSVEVHTGLLLGNQLEAVNVALPVNLRQLSDLLSAGQRPQSLGEEGGTPDTNPAHSHTAGNCCADVE